MYDKEMWNSFVEIEYTKFTNNSPGLLVNKEKVSKILTFSLFTSILKGIMIGIYFSLIR